MFVQFLKLIQIYNVGIMKKIFPKKRKYCEKHTTTNSISIFLYIIFYIYKMGHLRKTYFCCKPQPTLFPQTPHSNYSDALSQTRSFLIPDMKVS